MPISNVRLGNLFELFLKEAVLRGVNLPKAMADRDICLVLVLCHDTVGFYCLGDVSNLLLDGRVLTRAVGKEDWTNVCSLDISQFCPIELLFLQSTLVLLNQVVLIVCY